MYHGLRINSIYYEEDVIAFKILTFTSFFNDYLSAVWEDTYFEDHRLNKK